MLRVRRVPLLPALSGVLLAAAIGCGKGGKDPVVAKVGDREIHASAVTAAYLGMEPARRPPVKTLEERKHFLDDLINKEVMELVAFEKYPELSEAQKPRLKRFIDRELGDGAKRQLIRQQVRVTEAMKDTLYENMKRERLLRGMLILDRDAAQYVVEQLKAGGDFGILARDYSMQWVSHTNKGDMGWTQAGTLPYPVDVAVWRAPKGTLVGPILMPLGTYLVEVQDERPAEVKGSRQELDRLLEQKLTEPLYMNRQKEVQDSLFAAADPYYSAEGKALLNLKYFWEVPEEMAGNPMAKLDADRVVPTFTAAEETVTVVDFKTAPDWKAKEFSERLHWYPSGLWPSGESEEQLVEAMNLLVRDYLYIKAARDLGIENEAFHQKVEKRTREMRVTYFYYNDVERQYAPTQAEIDSFFLANREAYRAPVSYKLTVFGAKERPVIEALAAEWKSGGEDFEMLRTKFEKRSKTLVSIGETEWLYEGQDPARDELVAPLKEGGVSDPFTRIDLVMVVKLVSRRPSRIVSYGEVKAQVDKDAKTAIVDRKLSALLEERREKYGVKIQEKQLAQIVFPEGGAPADSAGGASSGAPAGSQGI